MEEKDLSQLITKHAKVRPSAKRKYDQFFATPETVAKRALKIKENGDMAGRTLFLGDDDMTSIALSKLEGSTKPITVLEVDQDLIGFIKRIAQKENLTIQVVEHDLLEELPKQVSGQFDTVFTDPPYTPSGVSLFLNRAIESLRKVYTSKIYLCYGSGQKASDRELAIQKVITDKGLLIREKIENFNEYVGASTIGNRSSLYVLEWTPRTQTTSLVNERIYTNQ